MPPKQAAGGTLQVTFSSSSYSSNEYYEEEEEAKETDKKVVPRPPPMGGSSAVRARRTFVPAVDTSQTNEIISTHDEPTQKKSDSEQSGPNPQDPDFIVKSEEESYEYSTESQTEQCSIISHCMRKKGWGKISFTYIDSNSVRMNAEYHKGNVVIFPGDSRLSSPVAVMKIRKRKTQYTILTPTNQIIM